MLNNYRAYKYYVNLDDIILKTNKRKRYLVLKSAIVKSYNAELNEIKSGEKKLIFLSFGDTRLESIKFDEIESAYLYKSHIEKFVFPIIYPKKNNIQTINTPKFISREIGRLKSYQIFDKLILSFFKQNKFFLANENCLTNTKFHFNKVYKSITPSLIIKYPRIYPILFTDIYFEKFYKYCKNDYEFVPSEEEDWSFLKELFTTKRLARLKKHELKLLNRKHTTFFKFIKKISNRYKNFASLEKIRKQRFLRPLKFNKKVKISEYTRKKLKSWKTFIKFLPKKIRRWRFH